MKYRAVAAASAADACAARNESAGKASGPLPSMSHARTLDGRRCEPLISEASCGEFQANLRSCIMAEPTRPPSIPASARYCADNAANFRWVDGPVDADGKPHGMTRTYSDDGLLHAEADHVNGTPEGLNTVFHPDGSVASTGEWRNGKMYDAVFFRAKGPSTEPFPGDVGPAVMSVRYCSLDGTANDRILYFDGAGQEVTDTGEPMPPRPASVDAEASWFPRRALVARWSTARGKAGQSWHVQTMDRERRIRRTRSVRRSWPAVAARKVF